MNRSMFDTFEEEHEQDKGSTFINENKRRDSIDNISNLKKYRIYTIDDDGTEHGEIIELPDDIFEEVNYDGDLDNTSFYIEEVKEEE